MAQNARSSFYQASMLRMINQKKIEISPFSPPAGKKIVPFVTRSGGLSSARLPVSTTRMRTHVEPYQFLHCEIGVPFFVLEHVIFTRLLLLQHAGSTLRGHTVYIVCLLQRYKVCFLPVTASAFILQEGREASPQSLGHEMHWPQRRSNAMAEARSLAVTAQNSSLVLRPSPDRSGGAVNIIPFSTSLIPQRPRFLPVLTSVFLHFPST